MDHPNCHVPYVTEFAYLDRGSSARRKASPARVHMLDVVHQARLCVANSCTNASHVHLRLKCATPSLAIRSPAIARYFAISARRFR